MLKSPEKYIVDIILGDAVVTETLGDRLFPVIAPADTPRPFGIWRRTNVQREHSLSGPTGLVTVALTFDIFAATYEGVRELADLFRQCLDGWGDQIGNYTHIRNVALQTESDGFAQLSGGDLPPVYSVSQTYAVLWGPE